jgi:hypothetical protein
MSWSLIFVGVVLHVVVFAQLSPTQHAALMNVYDGLGESREVSIASSVWLKIACSGCNETVCPRFLLPQLCNGSYISCSSGTVTAM